ncbi:NAD dependent epimerase/dehydratase family protein [Variibacter gotjawalensis]|uniref:NAD dependent epimerase/dehydratase family protein n=1 Tax=Variibacter gotjawalensis TaxID=1333996 RepID=A0A0S3PPY6_9BRAD|nr:NAD(P)H-binding protein [Variibacter gotjawalensis]NIK48303.1 nucleoside-diphosphate-sugar epimerase [Variibacter gotjawalensis]RZS50175.1 nucleoside-diphosphate-sugar epimerase [Variibacter gotjawalensis]BAT58005.1 NAD dependent epimerase/dehydratase family protein [Variibacter gotjawalensis]
MTEKILILGAAGRLGKACAKAFRDAGWDVISFVRAGADMRAAEGTTVIQGDALDDEDVLAAAKGASVILNAVNFPFGQWPAKILPQNAVAIAAAEATGATLMLPGNLFVYGKDMPPEIDETTPMHPQSRKGKLRLAVEQKIAVSSARTITLRAGDFFGGTNFGSWFDLVIARDVDLGVVRYPGPLLVPHAWAYLPDLAETFVKLAEKRDTLEQHAVFGFPGHPASGFELLAAIRAAMQKGLKRRSFPWFMLWLGSPFIANWREIVEVSHLWKRPNRIDGTKLQAAIGDIPETEFHHAVTQALDDLALRRTTGNIAPASTAD